jgi:hypothetical protein
MHVIVSWEIDAAAARRRSIHDDLKKRLAAFAWAAPLSALYVVKVSSEDDRQRILADLREVTEGSSTGVKIVVSPLMSGGMYTGVLPHELWLRVNEVAE